MHIICKLDSPRMIQVHVEITPELTDALECYFCELEHSPWMLRDDRVKLRWELFGYFETDEEARIGYAQLRSAFPGLPETVEVSVLEDRDWKEAYKDHFKPWSAGSLHWVPTWEKGKYVVPDGSQAIYLDPGMAFGTGNHETTRLCALRLVEAAEGWGGDLASRSVIDAGCGSGILAISAAAMGFGKIIGFDLDPDSVEIAIENAEVNDLARRVDFFQGDLHKGLPGVQADLVMANILANVLCAHSDLLLASVSPGGHLVLSGILAREVEDVRKVFEAAATTSWGEFSASSRQDGEWADVVLKRG